MENQSLTKSSISTIKSLFTASILTADAEEPSGMKIPIKCKWFRTKGSSSEQIKEITSNVY